MIVALDTSVLLLFLSPDTPPPRLPDDAGPLPFARERIEHLIAELDAAGARVLIPTPVLSEALVNACGAAPAYLDVLANSSCLAVADFDQRAAVELAAIVREAIAAGDFRSGSASPRQKIKVDRQIVATAKVNRASIIYSDDEDVARFGRRAGIRVVGTADLPPPLGVQGAPDLG